MSHIRVLPPQFPPRASSERHRAKHMHFPQEDAGEGGGQGRSRRELALRSTFKRGAPTLLDRPGSPGSPKGWSTDTGAATATGSHGSAASGSRSKSPSPPRTKRIRPTYTKVWTSRSNYTRVDVSLLYLPFFPVDYAFMFLCGFISLFVS